MAQRPLGRLVALLAREFAGRMAAVLQRHDLTDAGWWLLSELATAPAGGWPLGEVARRAGLGASTATLLSDQFADRGLLVRQRCPGNRRLVLAELTPSGHGFVRQVRTDLNNLFASTYERLSNAECETLTALLTRLLDSPSGDEAT